MLTDPVAARNTRLTNIVILLTCASLALGLVLIVSRIGLSGLRVNSAYIAIGALLYVWTPQAYAWKSAAVCLWIIT